MAIAAEDMGNQAIVMDYSVSNDSFKQDLQLRSKRSEEDLADMSNRREKMERRKRLEQIEALVNDEQDRTLPMALGALTNLKQCIMESLLRKR